jgi:hypothetical protein
LDLKNAKTYDNNFNKIIELSKDLNKEFDEEWETVREHTQKLSSDYKRVYQNRMRAKNTVKMKM